MDPFSLICLMPGERVALSGTESQGKETPGYVLKDRMPELILGGFRAMTQTQTEKQRNITSYLRLEPRAEAVR